MRYFSNKCLTITIIKNEKNYFIKNIYYKEVSGSNLSEGHTPNKKCSAGRSILEKTFYEKSPQN